MIETLLIPEKTVIAAKGEGEPFEITGAQNRVFLLSLKISQAVEQESLDVSVFGSANGNAWDAKPLAVFPQRFYSGETPILMDLTEQPEIKFVRAKWDVNRWGRGPTEPMFEVGLSLKEVPREILAEARTEATSRK